MEHNTSTGDDFSHNIFSVAQYQTNRPDVHVSDGDKAGATLLFSGLFLGLVGITFTVMGWIRRDGFERFEWTQLLGPILLSVGVTFALISVCKFKMLTCKSCKTSEDSALDAEQPTGGQSFVFTGINQPITFHGATVLQYIPPPYTPQDGFALNTTSLPPVLSPSLVNLASSTMCPPQYDSIYPMDNPTFEEDEPSPTQQPTYNGFERSFDVVDLPTLILPTNIPSDSPPLYEDIFPEIT
ncbi:transmembrane protein 174 [Rhinophrynus dorsalis]